MINPVEDSIPTRYSLLSRLQDWDDQESWRVFFDTYWRLIYSVAARSGLTESEAQDVVQETIICANVLRHERRMRALMKVAAIVGASAAFGVIWRIVWLSQQAP